MSGNQGSNRQRGYQRTYEERTASIQQRIRHLLDEHDRTRIVVRDNRPSAQDDVSRLVQAHAAIRPLCQLIRTNIVEYLRAETEWNRTISEFKLYDNRSAWAQEMLQQRNTFYHGLSLTSSPLDFLFAQLLRDAERTLEDIETFIQAEPSRNVQPYSTASAQQIATATTHSVGPAHLAAAAPDVAHSMHRPVP
ncbi:hypothetical protein AAVH_16977 [Aphelenchoides avenae]|nr:hypothetical protein AAVH_16977 [Aphelenchus avenae]